MFCIGFGQDSHKFADNGKALVLGGVVFTGQRGFVAHSDGDVVLHALFNALSGAIGGESIGYYFPDKEESNRNRDSKEFITFALSLVEEKGFKIGNIDINIEAAQPKITPRAVEMKQALSDLLSIKFEQIAIKATSGEGLTAFGRGEGVQVLVSVLLEKIIS
ncbi:MAG: 2-C-methyl-D-erythritol 2,4-cyclodiphosphate synthase [Deltaproteobacteria bacterium]|nr:2-C-methyl-D-erythritol 2,4-cyclodiphosphate synthase [Deltaproteobacteria bacterium]